MSSPVFDFFDPPPVPVTDAQVITISSPTFKISAPNSIYAMAYGGLRVAPTSSDVEVRLQRLERGQKFVRRGRVLSTVPQFNSQTIISQTTANNPFISHPVTTISFPSGQVPDLVAPTTANSPIFHPRLSSL